MITDEERHEIAEELRARRGCNGFDQCDECQELSLKLFGGTLALCQLDSDGVNYWEELADLIDRPDNPTCRNLSNDDRSFHCSRCGYKAFTYSDSDCDPEDFSYCPECRAEVVDE